MKNNFLSLVAVLHLFFLFQAHADVPVTSVDVQWTQVVDPKALDGELATLFQDQELGEYTPVPDLDPIEKKQLDQLPECLDHATNIPRVHARCYRFLSPKTKAYLNGLVKEEFDSRWPAVQIQVKVKEAWSLLFRSPGFLNLFTEKGMIPGETRPAQSFFSPFVKEELWKVPKEQINCAGAAFTAVASGFPQPRFIDFDQSVETLNQFFTRVDGEDLQWGDLIEFVLKEDFHFMVYAGTDSRTNERLVFTKNGNNKLPYMFMRYNVVHAIYDGKLGGSISQVRYYRMAKPFSAQDIPKTIF